jgi:hydroxylamine reductase
VIWKPANEADLVAKAATVGVLSTENEDVRSLRELTIYGVKGMAAYAGMQAISGSTVTPLMPLFQRLLQQQQDFSQC